MPDEFLLLTDDEVVALAVERDMAWPGGVPTVDPGSHDELAGAAFRGNRSLLARGMPRDDAGSEAAKIGNLVAGADGRIIVFVGNDGLQRESWAMASAHYAAGDTWLAETVSPVGIHRFSYQPVEDHRTFLEALVGGAAEAGPENGANDTVLCLLATGVSESILVRVGRGMLEARVAGELGSAPEESATPLSGPSQALDKLMAVVLAGRP